VSEATVEARPTERTGAPGPEAEPGTAAGPRGWNAVVRTPLSEGEAVERLRTLSRRGKLPGFSDRAPGGGLFRADAFGFPFDGELIGRPEPGAGDGVRLRLTVRVKPRLPVVFAVVTALAIFPGVILTDAFLVSFGWYAAAAEWTQTHLRLPADWFTYAWYLPLSIVPLPWAVAKLRRQTAASVLASAEELTPRIAAAIEGEVVQDAASRKTGRAE